MSANLPELISAYLDGEVTAEERAAVEQSLVEDATLRRLFYELRALRKQLARLPRYKLKADLSREVLRRAERALLLPAVVPAAQRSATEVAGSEREIARSETKVAPAQPSVGSQVTPDSRRPASWWQVASWLGAAAAAALLLIVLQPSQDLGPERIAMAPKQAQQAQDGQPKSPAFQRRVLPAGGPVALQPGATDGKLAAGGMSSQVAGAPATPPGPIQPGIVPADALANSNSFDESAASSGGSLDFAQHAKQKSPLAQQELRKFSDHGLQATEDGTREQDNPVGGVIGGRGGAGGRSGGATGGAGGAAGDGKALGGGNAKGGGGFGGGGFGGGGFGGLAGGAPDAIQPANPESKLGFKLEGKSNTGDSPRGGFGRGQGGGRKWADAPKAAQPAESAKSLSKSPLPNSLPGGEGAGYRPDPNALGGSNRFAISRDDKDGESGNAVDDNRLARTEGTVMIRCDVNGSEFEPLLRKTLARHNITWSEADGADAVEEKSLPAKTPDQKEVAQDRETISAIGGVLPGEAAPLVEQAKKKEEFDKAADLPRAARAPASPTTGLAAASDAELVYVVATREQIEGVLAELREQPQVFLAANVRPVPGSEAQAELTQWNWSAPADHDRLRTERDANETAEEKLVEKKSRENFGELQKAETLKGDLQKGDQFRADKLDSGKLDSNKLENGKTKLGKSTSDKPDAKADLAEKSRAAPPGDSQISEDKKPAAAPMAETKGFDKHTPREKLPADDFAAGKEAGEDYSQGQDQKIAPKDANDKNPSDAKNLADKEELFKRKVNLGQVAGGDSPIGSDAAKSLEKREPVDRGGAKLPPPPPGAALRMRFTVEPENRLMDQLTERKLETLKSQNAPEVTAAAKDYLSEGDREKRLVAPAAKSSGESDAKAKPGAPLADVPAAAAPSTPAKPPPAPRPIVPSAPLGSAGPSTGADAPTIVAPPSATAEPSDPVAGKHASAEATKAQGERSQSERLQSAPAQASRKGLAPTPGETSADHVLERAATPAPLRVLFVFRVQPAPVAATPAASGGENPAAAASKAER